ncbi:MAG: class I SAM-dependent methyltransferase [Candidatus Omnitrophica bacterium]|nr:class I SAM-dependent methyltransferase [Candidatus Omnitrophota bacterium]
MSGIFDKYYKQYDAWYDRNTFSYLSELEAVKNFLPRKGKGLEIGVGTGRFAHALGIQYGIDPSKEMLKIAAWRGVHVQQAAGEDIPFPEDTFDYVAIIISLCFVHDPLKVLKESYRVLKQNGRIILGIVDKNSFLGKFYQKKKSIFYKDAHFFSVEEISKLLAITEFPKVDYSQTLFDLPSEMTAVQKPRKGYGQGGFVVISARKREGNVTKGEP